MHGNSTPNEVGHTPSRTPCREHNDCYDVNKDLDVVDLVRLEHIYGTTTLPIDTVISTADHGSTTTGSATLSSGDRVEQSTSTDRSRLQALSPRKLWPTTLTPRGRLLLLRVSTPACWKWEASKFSYQSDAHLFVLRSMLIVLVLAYAKLKNANDDI
jgi:hypothetical protein